MHYLVTGAAGFLGSHLCDRLLRDGHSVLGMDNFITGNPRNLAHWEGDPRLTFAQVDIVEPFECEPVDGVFHLASPASPKDYLEFPVETLRVGSEGTRNALEIARRYDVPFLITSTSESYGDPLEHPQKESYWGNVNPVGPRSCYDESKRFGEAMTMAYHRHYGVNTRIARVFNTYGPRMKLNDGRIVPAFVGQALRGEPMTVFGDGSQTRSFCYVDDLIDGLVRLFGCTHPEPVNLGNPVELTVKEFAERIRQITGAVSPIVYRPLPQDDPQRRRPDITKARELLGWEPKIDLDRGLQQTIHWFQQNQ